jgi:hypothetical protein
MRVRLITLALLLFWSSSCAVGGTTADPMLDASIRALSTTSASLGSLVDFYVEDLPPPQAGQLTVVFDGTFTTPTGSRSVSTVEVPVRRVDGGTLRWTSFGPYRVPFGAVGDQIGTFVGEARIRLIDTEGTILESRTPKEVTFEVLPSIRISRLEPTAASCAGPVLRAIGGLPYILEAEALGFTPASFTYTLTIPATDTNDSWRELADGAVGTLGTDGTFVLPAVPDGVQAYGAVISVEARDVSGATHQTLFAVGVHRPMEVTFDGRVAIAETYAPVVVSGCLPGGESGREASYTETESETRSRSYGVDFREGWLESTTETHSESTTNTTSSSNTIGFSTTNGSSFNWQVGMETGGSIGIEGIIEVGAKVNGHVGGETFSQSTSSRSSTTGRSHSETTTDTTSATSERSGSSGEEFRWEVSSSEALERGFSAQIFAGQYGVFYRQTSRLIRRASLVTYNLCGVADVAGDVELQDWTWATDLAQSPTCPPLPESHLPAAACLIQPCGENR